MAREREYDAVRDRDVQISMDTEVPHNVKEQMFSEAKRFLYRYTTRFGFARVYLHLKRENRRILYSMQFITDRGLYVTRAIGWGAEAALAEAFKNVDLQLRKSSEMRGLHG